MQKAITLTVRHQTMRGMEHVPTECPTPLPAVILCHGFTANKLQEHRMFLKLCRMLESIGFACFRFDFLGSGESDGDFIDMTVSNEIEETKAILEFVRRDPRVDNTRVTLLGLSMGGLVAGIVAGDCNEQIKNLVLVAPAGNMPELMMAGPLGEMIRSGEWQTSRADAWGNQIGQRFLEDLSTVDGFERAKPFQGDVLIVHGTNDQSVPFDVAHRYQTESFDGRATLHFIEGSDHTFNHHLWEREMLSTICEYLAERM